MFYDYGGDFNFSFGNTERIFGPFAQVDPLFDYVFRKLKEVGFLNNEHVKLRPTWRKKKVGEERIAKRLDRFFILESWLGDPRNIGKWVGLGGEYVCFNIFI